MVRRRGKRRDLPADVRHAGRSRVQSALSVQGGLNVLLPPAGNAVKDSETPIFESYPDSQEFGRARTARILANPATRILHRVVPQVYKVDARSSPTRAPRFP